MLTICLCATPSGFGFLMTFLRRYSYGAVMLNFLGSCLMFLVAILILGAAQQVGLLEEETLPLICCVCLCLCCALMFLVAIVGAAQQVCFASTLINLSQVQ